CRVLEEKLCPTCGDDVVDRRARSAAIRARFSPISFRNRRDASNEIAALHKFSTSWRASLAGRLLVRRTVRWDTARNEITTACQSARERGTRMCSGESLARNARVCGARSREWLLQRSASVRAG